MKISQLAINTVSTRHSSLEGALEAYAAAGFRQVEFQLGHLKDLLAQGHNVADAGALLAGVHVLILTTFEINEYGFVALRSGASGFAVKDIEPADLLQAVRVVAGGEALLSPSVTRRLIAEFASRPERRAGSPAKLTALSSHLPTACHASARSRKIPVPSAPSKPGRMSSPKWWASASRTCWRMVGLVT